MGKTSFDYTLDFDNINFREHPEWYRTGVGEQGVLLVETLQVGDTTILAF